MYSFYYHYCKHYYQHIIISISYYIYIIYCVSYLYCEWIEIEGEREREEEGERGLYWGNDINIKLESQGDNPGEKGDPVGGLGFGEGGGGLGSRGNAVPLYL